MEPEMPRMRKKTVQRTGNTTDSMTQPDPQGTTRERLLDLILNGTGRPASVRELATDLGLSSPASVHRHLKKLAQEGWITQVPGGGARSWEPCDRSDQEKTDRFTSSQQIPIVGRIAAGVPIESCLEGGHSPDHWLDMPPTAFGQKRDVVALLIEGESMREAGIHSGDHAVIRCQPKVENGEIAAVTIDGEGTLKRWRVASGRRPPAKIQLEAAHPDFPPLVLKKGMGEIQVFGKLIGIVRKFPQASGNRASRAARQSAPIQ